MFDAFSSGGAFAAHFQEYFAEGTADTAALKVRRGRMLGRLSRPRP